MPLQNMGTDCYCEPCGPVAANDCIYDVFPPDCLALADTYLEVEVEISGVSQGTCEDDCTAANGVHLFETNSPEQIWYTSGADNCYAQGGRTVGCGSITYTVGKLAGVYVLTVTYSNTIGLDSFTIRWELTDAAALTAIEDICNGDGPITLPNVLDVGSLCDGPGTCTINFL